MASFPRRGPALTLVAGLLIREAFSFWTGHPFDFELWVRLGYGVAHGLDPYSALPPAPGLSFADDFSPQGGSAVIGYLPFWPFVAAGAYLLYLAVGAGDRFVYYFLLKQPIILSDVALAYLMYAFVLKRNPGRAGWALRFWVFSPVAISIAALWGMFDSVAMAFVMLALAARRSPLDGIWSGLATFAKSLPLIFSIPLTLRDLRRPWSLILSILLPAASSLAVFALMGWNMGITFSTLSSTVTKGGESMSAWDLLFFLNTYAGLPYPPGWAREIVGSLWVPAVLVATAFAYRRFGFRTDQGVVQSMLLVSLVFVLVRYQVNEQYSIYLLALSALDVAVWHWGRRRLLLLVLASVMGFMLANNFLFVRFLAPVYPGWQAFEAGATPFFVALRYSAKLVFALAFTAAGVAYLRELVRGPPLPAEETGKN
ncbi:MAG: hypothetical protein JRN39_07485 [Nitrososphaerota archaeon]|nr:hypothetical protein [Nitrososphaerota archaeon]